MKILHVIPGVAPRYGGPSQAIYRLGEALAASGVQVLIATTDADGPGELPVELGQLVSYQNVPTIFFRRQWSEAFKYSRPLAVWLEQNIRTFALVHIHAVFSHSSLAAAHACRRAGVPYVVRTLGALAPWSLGYKRARKWLFWRLGVRRMLQGAAALHYTTEAEKRLAEQVTGLQGGMVIPLGVSEARLPEAAALAAFRQQHPQLAGNPYCLVLSRLHPVKGLELLLECFLAATRAAGLTHWRLVLAGDGEAAYVNQLKQLAQRADSAGQILFTGWLSGAEKAAALHQAELFVLASFQENFGLSVAEALACGVPVLVSDQVNLADEVAAAGAGWVAPLSRAALTAGLQTALADGAERARRGRAARRLAETKFAWSAVVQQLRGLYQQVLAAAPPPKCSAPN